MNEEEEEQQQQERNAERVSVLPVVNLNFPWLRIGHGHYSDRILCQVHIFICKYIFGRYQRTWHILGKTC